MNRDKAIVAVRDLLKALDQDINSEGLKDTPTRVADSLIEQCVDIDPEIDRVFSEERYDELILMRDIPFSSYCEHHLIPYFGMAHVAYLPLEKLLGISKLARLVYSQSRGFTIQERVTMNIADILMSDIAPYGCMVVIEAHHGCVSLRGAKAFGASTVTSAVRGLYRDSQAARQECLNLIMRRR